MKLLKKHSLNAFFDNSTHYLITYSCWRLNKRTILILCLSNEIVVLHDIDHVV